MEVMESEKGGENDIVESCEGEELVDIRGKKRAMKKGSRKRTVSELSDHQTERTPMVRHMSRLILLSAMRLMNFSYDIDLYYHTNNHEFKSHLYNPAMSRTTWLFSNPAVKASTLPTKSPQGGRPSYVYATVIQSRGAQNAVPYTKSHVLIYGTTLRPREIGEALKRAPGSPPLTPPLGTHLVLPLLPRS
ncbi:hypothetical protein P154DRAFT_539084 [Amniculicola lignicola CBS 123094]|uniref:Uncharacterized protein n=1 Tax=Amniculicola lignicola CBS 123094 TaxID=1392246 RepID=A0A6A5VZY5_9PLEO|nr:hypothetical protein P154DRAFT_539084 [Amniculicola lignicola CBS 123094]